MGVEQKHVDQIPFQIVFKAHAGKILHEYGEATGVKGVSWGKQWGRDHSEHGHGEKGPVEQSGQMSAARKVSAKGPGAEQ